MQKSFWRLFGLFLVLALLTQISLHPASAQQSDTLTTLENTTIPPRDLADLAQRLLSVTSLPNTPSAPKAYQTGDQENFTAINNDTNSDFTVTEQLWYATPHVYMWFEQGFTPDLDAVKRSADHFETDIYPTVRSYFGTEDTPGIDNDVHLYIVHAYGLGGVAGYFEARSQYPKVAVPASNEHQMFFMNLDNVRIGTKEYESILAHEFQHMVHANMDKNEQGWIDEGLAELASALAGYNDLKDIPGFASYPQLQLNTWNPDGNNGPHYGASYAFNTYFLQRFGDNALRTLVKEQADGFEGVRNALKTIKATDPDTKKPVTLEDFFGDWVLANLLDTDPNTVTKYHYTKFDSPFPPVLLTPAIPDSPQSLTTSQWGTTYLVLNQAGTYHLKFEGQPTVKVVPTDAHSGKYAWWSTSFDRSDTKLTREFDLTKATKATLNFALWHTVEKSWDYGYVMASEDGGKTWKVLHGQHTTEDRHNNPYGDGYTGYSGGSDRSSAAWVDESVDLSAYAGKKIQIRFEYITDDSTTERGLLIDDVSIPEIGYSTDFESVDDGWVADGFVRMDNTLPQRYLVQMAEYGSPIAVTRLLTPDQGITGEWDITVGFDVSKVVIAVSGMTEFTIEPASFQYTLTQTK